MEEEEALRSYCRTMISRVRNKRGHLHSPGEEERTDGREGGRGGERTGPGRRAAAGGREPDLPVPDPAKRGRRAPSLGPLCPRPETQTVPPQLVSTLRLKNFKEEMRRAAEVERHDPAVCSVCEQEQAFLALKRFIRRKETQLRFQTLKGRLNTHLGHGDHTSWAS